MSASGFQRILRKLTQGGGGPLTSSSTLYDP